MTTTTLMVSRRPFTLPLHASSMPTYGAAEAPQKKLGMLGLEGQKQAEKDSAKKAAKAKLKAEAAEKKVRRRVPACCSGCVLTDYRHCI